MVGVDAAADMIAAAKKRGLDARVMEGGKLEFNAEFDAVFSNAALHWMKSDRDAVIAGVVSRAQTRRPFRRRDGRSWMCRGDHDSDNRGTRAAWDQGRGGDDPVVFPDGGRLSRTTRARRLQGRLYRADSAADAAADQYGRMDRTIRAAVSESVAGRSAGARGGRSGRVVAADAVRRAGPLDRPTTCGCGLPRAVSSRARRCRAARAPPAASSSARCRRRSRAR